MKTSLVVLSLAASASAFVPSTSSSRPSVAREALADRIFDMNLFDKDNNKYGARDKKQKYKTGALTDRSYVPSGLTKAEYEAIRKKEVAKKEENYKKNVAKAFKYTDFSDWYAKRGTELAQGWKKTVTLGHTMAKTKYDWSGVADAKKFESTNTKNFSFTGKAKPTKAAPKKTVEKKKLSFF